MLCDCLLHLYLGICWVFSLKWCGIRAPAQVDYQRLENVLFTVPDCLSVFDGPM